MGRIAYGLAWIYGTAYDARFPHDERFFIPDFHVLTGKIRGTRI
jgi:hypothetical protein